VSDGAEAPAAGLFKTDTTIASLPLETKLADNATDLRQARAH
jgi:hypothetical protein